MTALDLPNAPRVLLPLALDEGQDDLTPAAVTAAASLTQKLNGHLHLVTSLGPTGWLPIAGANVEQHETMAGLRDQALRASAGRLEELAEAPRKAGLEVSTKVLGETKAIHDAIVDEILEWRADLVVLPTHNKPRLKRILLGSVANRVSHLSPVSVLLLREV